MKKQLFTICLTVICFILLFVVSAAAQNPTVMKGQSYRLPTAGFGNDTLQCYLIQNKNLLSGYSGFVAIQGTGAPLSSTDTLWFYQDIDGNIVIDGTNTGKIKLAETTYIPAGEYFGVGHTSPSLAVDVRGTTGATSSMVMARASADNMPPNYVNYKARGNLTTLGKVQLGDTLGRYSWMGYDGAFDTDTNAATIVAIATENFKGGAHGTKMVFRVTANDGNQPVDAIKIDQDKSVTMYDSLYVTDDIRANLNIVCDDTLKVGKFIGINNNTPLAPIDGIGTSAANNSWINRYYGNDATTAGNMLFWRFKGTTTVPTVTVNNDYLGTIPFFGYDTGALPDTNSAVIRAISTQTHGIGYHGGKLEFKTTSNAYKNAGTVALTLGQDQTATFADSVSVTGAAKFNSQLYIPKVTTHSVDLADSIVVKTKGIIGQAKLFSVADLSVLGWKVLGNAGTTAGTNFVGTTDNIALQFKTNNTLAQTINTDQSVNFADSIYVTGGTNLNTNLTVGGKIGINTGTTAPLTALDIVANTGYGRLASFRQYTDDVNCFRQVFLKGRGSFAVPAVPNINDDLGGIEFYGYENYHPSGLIADTNSATIEAVAASAFTKGLHGGKLRFLTTPATYRAARSVIALDINSDQSSLFYGAVKLKNATSATSDSVLVRDANQIKYDLGYSHTGSDANYWNLAGNTTSGAIKKLGFTDNHSLRMYANNVYSARLDSMGYFAALSSTADANPARIRNYKDRSGGTITTGDTLASWSAFGHNGTAYRVAAAIKAQHSSATGAANMGGELSFWTATDAVASALTKRLTIDNAGVLNVPIAGKVLIGTYNAAAGFLTANRVGSTGAQLSLYQWSTSAGVSNAIRFYKSRDADEGDVTATADLHELGKIEFYGVTSGNAFAQSSEILSIQNGASGASRMISDFAFRQVQATGVSLATRIRFHGAKGISLSGNSASANAITSPTYAISFVGDAAQSIGVEANTTAVAGANLSLNGGASSITSISTIGAIVAGNGYNVGDVLTLSGGTGGTCTVATLTGGAGSGVATVTITTVGAGYSTGVKTTTVSPAGGTGCTINITAIGNAADANGGMFLGVPGTSAGTGFSSVRFQRNSRAATTSTTLNTPTDAVVIPSSKPMSDNTSTTLFNVACANGTSTGVTINYTIKTSGAAGNASHTEVGTVYIIVGNDDAAFTVTATKASSAQAITDAGTYTVTFAASSATPTVVSVTADSSLDVASTISYVITNSDGQVITQL